MVHVWCTIHKKEGQGNAPPARCLLLTIPIGEFLSELLQNTRFRQHQQGFAHSAGILAAVEQLLNSHLHLPDHLRLRAYPAGLSGEDHPVNHDVAERRDQGLVLLAD